MGYSYRIWQFELVLDCLQGTVAIDVIYPTHVIMSFSIRFQATVGMNPLITEQSQRPYHATNDMAKLMYYADRHQVKGGLAHLLEYISSSNFQLREIICTCQKSREKQRQHKARSNQYAEYVKYGNVAVAVVHAMQATG